MLWSVSQTVSLIVMHKFVVRALQARAVVVYYVGNNAMRCSTQHTARHVYSTLLDLPRSEFSDSI